MELGGLGGNAAALREDPMRVSVRDGLGREVTTSFTLTLQRPYPLDMSAMASGAYYMVVTRNGQQQVVKLLVEH